MMDAHILVIDDAPDLRALYADAFAEEGYRVTLMEHVPTDLGEIDAVQPDVIVVDYLLNGHPHGWHLVQALKQRPATQRIPILVCTAATRTMHAHVAYLHAQQIGLLLKRFALDALLDGIAELVGDEQATGPTRCVPAAVSVV